MKKVIVKCDRCKSKQKEGKEFWATIEYKSNEYFYDDGTQKQNFTWHLCRKCKVDLQVWVEEKGKENE